MLGKNHLAFGITSALAASVILNNAGIELDYTTVGIITASSAFGSLLPDIDDPNSLIGRIFVHIASFINKVFGHRTITHDLMIFLPLFIASLITSLFVKDTIFFGIMFGYMGHLFLDSLTEQGICFNYFGHRKALRTGWGQFGVGYIHLLPEKLRFKSSSFMAKVVTTMFCALNIYAVYSMYAVNLLK